MKIAAAVVCAATMALGACASMKFGDEPVEIDDPFEGLNRKLFIVNGIIDRGVFQPTARAYVKVVPAPARDGVRNFTRNLGSPVTFVNDLAQGEMKRAGVTLGRTILNTTIGLGGFIDVAAKLGLDYHREDFGQTLAVYGAPPGAFVYVPIFGPSTGRGGFGQIVDNLAAPVTWTNELAITLGNGGAFFVNGVDIRARNLERIDNLERGSVDFYAAVKSLWWQNRLKEIRNGRTVVEDLPDFEFDDFDDE